MAAHSTFHANGFAKIVLEPGAPAPRAPARLAAAATARPALVNPHGHRWPFASWVITGALREVLFDPAPHGERFEVYDYPGTNGPLPDRPSASVSLAYRPARFRRAGTVYTRRPGELHVAEPATDALVAIARVQGTEVRTSTPVYRSPGHRRPEQGSPISPAHVCALLEEVTACSQRV